MTSPIRTAYLLASPALLLFVGVVLLQGLHRFTGRSHGGRDLNLAAPLSAFGETFAVDPWPNGDNHAEQLTHFRPLPTKRTWATLAVTAAPFTLIVRESPTSCYA